jgi:hypothetical protein
VSDPRSDWSRNWLKFYPPQCGENHLLSLFIATWLVLFSSYQPFLGVFHWIWIKPMSNC